MLELQHICYDVEQDGEDKGILRDIDLTIDERFVAITGPNGGGKSTLAKIIAGIYTPTSGRILLDGEDITGLDITQRARRGVSFAFQQPVRFKGLTVKDLITLASGKNIGVPEACNYLSEVGLCAKDYIDREVDGSLSGGELKRIEIAMIMARGTKLSVFDEPEAGIDLWSFSKHRKRGAHGKAHLGTGSFHPFFHIFIQLKIHIDRVCHIQHSFPTHIICKNKEKYKYFSLPFCKCVTPICRHLQVVKPLIYKAFRAQ